MPKYLTYLWRLSQGERGRILRTAICGVFRILTSLVFVWVCKSLIDIATGDQEGSFLTMAIAICLCPLAQLLFGALAMRSETHSEINTRNRLRSILFEKYINGQWLKAQSNHSGDLVNRLMSDSTVVSNCLCVEVPFAIETMVQLTGVLIFFFYLNVKLSLVLIMVIPLGLIAGRLYIPKMRNLTSKVRSSDSEVQACLQEGIQHVSLIKSMEYQKGVLSKLGMFQDRLRSNIDHRMKFSLFSRIVVRIGFSAAYVIAFIWCATGLSKGTITFGTMTAFLQLLTLLQRPTMNIGKIIPSFAHSFASIDRLEVIYNIPSEETAESSSYNKSSGSQANKSKTPIDSETYNPTDKCPQIPLKGQVGIQINHITYSYPESDKKIYDGLSFDFLPGTMTAITGETGVGKSTLFRLLLDLVEPQNGEILFYDSETGQRLKAGIQTRKYLSVVPQGNSLLSGTIRENLLLGNPDATAGQMWQALKIASADFVENLKDGLDSKCGESGAGLSEGQAQRIAIARALLRDRQILILDEPTSALDSETEQKLMSNLKKYCQGKTIIIVTHNPEVAQMCQYRLDLE